MRSVPLVAAALMLVLPGASLANPAAALSVSRAAATMEDGNALTRGEIYPLIGLAALAVLVIALANEKVEGEGPVSA